MSAREPQHQRMILTEDGELREPVSTAESQSQPLFCTTCGTANRASSRFCRKCGESLDDQVLDPGMVQDVRGPGRKSKRSAWPLMQPMRQPVQPSASALAVEALTMVFVAGMVISTAAITGSVLLPIVILLAWFLVEAARHGALN